MNAVVTPIPTLAGSDAAYPNVINPVPTAHSPVVQAATGPNDFKNRELTNADIVKLTNANDVNAIPTLCVLNPSTFCSKLGKKAKNVESAAWYSPLTMATLTTPVHSFDPRGHDIISVLSPLFDSLDAELFCVSLLAPSSVDFDASMSSFAVDVSDAVVLPFTSLPNILLSLSVFFTNNITDADAISDAMAEHSITNDI